MKRGWSMRQRGTLGILGSLLVFLLIARLLGLRYTRSVHPVGFEHPENELMKAIEARRSGPAQEIDAIIRIIHDDPDQLLEPGPFGELALGHAVIAGLSDAVEHLLLDNPRIYESEYLLRVARDAHNLEHDGCLPYFALAVPADRPQWYASQIQHDLNAWDIDLPAIGSEP